MEIIGLLFLGFMGAAIYGMVTRKSKCIKYGGRLKPLSSVGHFLATTSLVCCVLGAFAASGIMLISGAFLAAVTYLLICAALVAVGYFYLTFHLRKLEALVPEQPAVRTLADQYLIGIGTFYYTGFSIAFFWLAFFGLPVFIYDWS